MKKKILAMLLTVSMMFSISVPAFATIKPATSKENSEIHVSWVNTDTATATLNFSGDCADCSSIIHGKDGSSRITATALLKH